MDAHAIQQSAINAANVAARPLPAEWPREDNLFDQALYDFVCDGFPDAAAVAGKFYELHQLPLPWPSFDEAPAPVRAWFMTFRSVVEALQPLLDGA